MKKSIVDDIGYSKVIPTTKVTPSITSIFKTFVYCYFLNNDETYILFMLTWSPLLLPLLLAPFDNEHYKPTSDSLCPLSHFNPLIFITSIT
jgi:hypothetical protein